MNEVTERFIQVYHKLIELGLISNAKEFAEAIGISASMITETLKGRSNIGIMPIQKTVLTFHISPTFLLTGEGAVFDTPAAVHNHRKTELEGVDIPTWDSPTLPVPANGTSSSGFIRLPFTMAEAGGIYYAIRLKSENMFPTIPSGSRLIVRMLTDSPQQLEDGQIYTVWDTKGKSYTGRLRPQATQEAVLCISDHPDKSGYPDIRLATEDIKAIARVEWVISSPQPAIYQAFGQKVARLEEEMAAFNTKLQEISNHLKT